MVLWIGLVLLVSGALLILSPVGWNIGNALQRRSSDEEYERLNDRGIGTDNLPVLTR